MGEKFVRVWTLNNKEAIYWTTDTKIISLDPVNMLILDYTVFQSLALAKVLINNFIIKGCWINLLLYISTIIVQLKSLTFNIQNDIKLMY